MGSCFFPWHSSNESLYHCRVWNRGCCLSKCNCTICLCVFSEALSSVEKFGSTSARVDILSTSGIPVSLGVERSSFPSPVNAGVVLSSKVLNLDSGSLVTDVTPETMEKLVSHGDVNLDRTVVYLSVVVLAIVVALHSVDASGWVITLVAVDDCSVLEGLPWNTDVNKV